MMGLRWTDTIDIAIELLKHILMLTRSGFVLPICIHGCVLCQILAMTQTSQQKVCLKPFRWHGLMKAIKNG
jgi:hypothetical protein